MSESMWSSSRYVAKRSCDRQEALLDSKLRKLTSAQDGMSSMEDLSGPINSATVQVQNFFTLFSVVYKYVVLSVRHLVNIKLCSMYMHTYHSNVNQHNLQYLI